ncbi:reverse transcriptase domain-containing protein [Roseateles noduli]|uniref:reverse transcriptase domain-containing protein n=1 Tax=Roseateles noduli TaxID=2052484 RepID=UPI003D651E6D
MSDRVLTRAEIIERIRASSKDAVVLEEMQRLGFWPAGDGKPSIEAALIEREVELMRALDEVQATLRTHSDPEAAMKAMREQRMAESRARREATAQAREQRRHERALRWHAARKTDAGYLGAGVSGGLQAPATDAGGPPRVSARPLLDGLPALATPLDLAGAMGLTLPELKFLCFHREVARTTHYRRFLLPKKTGGQRTISAPMPRLKRAQYWVLDQLLAKVPCHAAAHGFLPGRGIVSNAAPHTGRAVVINLDIKDFFPTVTFPRIKGVFRGLGYDERVATMLALLCSENPCDELEVDGERFFVGGKGRDRVLPQGAPTSPMLTNVLCRKMDRRLQGLADKLGFTYTRYADDLTFSASGEGAAKVGTLLRQARHVLLDEGFTPHPDKQRVMRAGSRQEVTGVVVNEKPSVSREERRKLRAALHKATRDGLEAATWHGYPATREVLVGYGRFVAMVDRQQGAPLLKQALALPGGSAKKRSAFGALFRRKAAEGEAPTLARGAWWKPADRPEPVLQQTAGQIKAARQERINAARAERRGGAASKPDQYQQRRQEQSNRAAENAARWSAATSVRPSTPAAAPLNWGLYARQFGVMALAATLIASWLVFFGGLAHLALRIKTRSTGWGEFWIGLILLIAVAVKFFPHSTA